MNNETLKRDLCARLMDGVKVMDIWEENVLDVQYASQTYDTKYVGLKICIERNERFKPYLFSTSALTKEIQLANYNNGEPFVPKYELEKILGVYQCNYLMDNLDLIISKKKIPQEKVHFEFIDFVKAIDFLNKIHINYRLSPDQFIEVTEEFNPYK